MGALMRAQDWAFSPLGDPQGWPQALKSYVSLMLAAAQPMFIAWGPDQTWLYNDAFAPMLGQRRSDALGRPARQVWAQSWRELEPLFTKVLGGEPVQADGVSLGFGLHDGAKAAAFDVACTPVRGDAEAICGLLGICMTRTAGGADDLELDVFERSRVGGQTWRLSPDLLGVANGDGYFESSNPAWRTVLGWSRAELKRTPFLDLVHADDRAKTLAALDGLRRGQPALRFENRYRCKDGSYRWLSWVAVPEGGKFYCNARDITVEKGQAAELADKTAERDRLWETSRDLLVVLGLDGVLRATNPAWGHVLGWEQDEVVGRSHLNFVHPDDEPISQAALLEAAAGQMEPVAVRCRHKDGGWRWISWVAAPGDGVVFASGRHVTAEKHAAEELAEAQAALRQAHKMEAVGQLTGGIAHDFNNLLAGIGGSLELLQKRLSDGRLGGLERYIDTAQTSARRAAALTQRLLAFSRRQTLDPKPTDMNKLILGMEDLIRRTVGPDVALEFVGAGGLWPTRVDPSQLETALLNLCINGRDAMAPLGGRLTIETSNKWLDERAAKTRELPPGQYVSVCVTDTGSGMSPEVIERAFEPFYTTKPLGQGTGLGLSMIYGFARQSGGQIRIYSELGKGTTMCLYLPRYTGLMADDDDAPPASIKGGDADGEVVMVVDDEDAVRMLVVEVLGDLGYAAIEATDGPSALKILQADRRVDLLITDVGLPGGLNGRQIADAARQNRPDLKVLFITGYAENAVVGNGHLDPGMEIITKPFVMTALGAKIRDLIER
jgi:PAS domain S-box-containing protein